ncbi:MAG: AAA family ATPase [Okeania sp. SIO3I5]|uniref:protein kinase domain-containing protein n=1 Tax=Okeania sp. SIO3I5 TaxID=2607805 RepID=UPI0013B95274|nr:AAA family ATPase [Okeania sp. SIO3I5]NEQ35536.1 AAA family ATPase [Okeania sp. SIO3I5]
MVTLAGYNNFYPIHNSTNSQVYRARRVDDHQPVILKFLNQNYPTSEQIRRYKQEYYLTCQLKSPGIIKAYDLLEWQRSYVIVLEDFEGISLQEFLQGREKLTLKEFLFLAIAIVESLGEIHNQHIIHKDINPANIVFNPQTQELKIIDFGISTQLSRENPTLKNPNVLEGTLAYISPEQTGRMNRSLDYRTDFYSLGVTFYEMLTKQLPFTTEDALELVHSHIAKKPILPSEIDSSIPWIISQIIMKLMAKNAEERYQSAWGLKADLENCSEQLELVGNIEVFPLATQDISERFSIPQKLYGREAEIATLLSTFERVAKSGKVELMMVAGYSGIGKSSLVQELYKPITARRGYFISGKFDQFQRNIPYSAIVSAFGGLIRQLLGETKAGLGIWREKLLKALGNNGQVIIDVIPEVELIIGKQPPVPILGANETQNRFNLVISNFIYAFCTEEHPLTLFLDDLQWVDLATLKLMERMLVEKQTEYLLLLGAYRDNEVNVGHSLAISLEKLRQNNNAINQISLKNLSLNQITCLITDTFSQTKQVSHLAQLVWEKTGGNPFFVNEFLQTLYDKKMLEFDRQERTWQWDIEAIAARNFTENVVELMIEKLQQLPECSQKTLSLAACLGAEFDLKILTWIEEKLPSEIFELLKIPLELGFIFPLSEMDENLLIQSYKFGHDRIQQAAYALIPDDEKATLHYQIGKVLLQKLSEEARVENIFDLVRQLNYGIELITEQKERDELAQLNLIACRKARNTSAYQAAREYADMGLSILGENSWQRQYEMSLELHELKAELAWLCGDFEEMEQFIEIVIAKAQSLLEQVNVCKIKIISNYSQNKLTEAIATALEFLQKLGVSFPEAPTDSDIQSSIAEIGELIGDTEIEDLADLPIMTDREKIAILQIFNSVIQALYILGSSLWPLLVALSVKLSIQYGNSEASGVAYVLYAIITCDFLKDVDTGVKFGQLALKVVSKLDAKTVKSQVLHLAGMFLLHRQYHYKRVLPLWEEAYAVGLEVGNLEPLGPIAAGFCGVSLWSGRFLTTLEQETRLYCNRLIQLNQLTGLNWNRLHWQLMLNLLGASAEHPSILSGEAFQETELLPQLLSARDLVGLYLFYLYKLMLCYLFGEIKSANSHAAKCKGNSTVNMGSPGEAIYYLYDSLTALALLSLQPDKTSELFQRVEENQGKLQQRLADYAPMNYQHKVDLVEAEKCRFLGKKAEAIELYNKAIALAQENEYIQEEALANELAAKFYLDWGQEKLAGFYMTDAHYCYSLWGAIAKVRHLEENYPQLFQSQTTKKRVPKTLKTPTTNNYTDGTELDLATVIKSTNAISSEIVLDNLLATLMDILVKNAGAQRGILILPRGESLFIEATKEAELSAVSVLQSLPLNKFEKLSEKIVRYVARTRETVVLNNASTEGDFTEDAYIQEYQCQSIACTPLINQNQLQGIIYLENNLSAGAFTQERMALLRTLAAQGAISLENARLYDACQRFVPEQFLSFLEKKSIIDVELGEQVEREMTVLFSDIRGFTTISEQMTPGENFAFINEYLGYMEPQIQKHGGFIDKYIGDAIMALFPNSADDALKGAIAMLEELKKYNLSRQQKNINPLRIGIGLHTGKLILGTVGGLRRMDGTVIGDAVNLSSRVEGLTKTYGVSLLITHQTLARLNNPVEYDLRFIEQVKAKGKAKAVGLFEVFAADVPELRAAKNATKEKFEKAVILYHQKSFVEAGRLFEECVAENGGDHTASSYLERCGSMEVGQ